MKGKKWGGSYKAKQDQAKARFVRKSIFVG